MRAHNIQSESGTHARQFCAHLRTSCAPFHCECTRRNVRRIIIYIAFFVVVCGAVFMLCALQCMRARSRPGVNCICLRIERGRSVLAYRICMTDDGHGTANNWKVCRPHGFSIFNMGARGHRHTACTARTARSGSDRLRKVQCLHSMLFINALMPRMHGYVCIYARTPVPCA